MLRSRRDAVDTRGAARGGLADHPTRTGDGNGGTVPPSPACHECPMCRHAFPETDMSCHSGCPMVRHCGVVCCPQCGYEFVDTRKTEARMRRVGRFFRRLFQRRSASREAAPQSTHTPHGGDR